MLILVEQSTQIHDTWWDVEKPCQDASRRDGLPIQTSPSGSHSPPIQSPGAACATIRRYLRLCLKRGIHWRQMGVFVSQKKKTLHHETLFLKWYHSLAKSLPGKEKGNWIKNTSFLKFGVCFEVEDHHGTDNTINISMGEAGSWVSRCFKCWLRFTSAMLPTLVPRCPQSCWYTSWLVKKRGKGTRRTKLAKPKQTWFNDAKKKKVGSKTFKLPKVPDVFLIFLLVSQVTSGPKAQPQVSVVGWHLTSWKVMKKSK